MASDKNPLTPQQKERILFLHTSGVAIADIARELGITDNRKVSGFIRSAINMGKIPPPPQGTSFPETTPMPEPTVTPPPPPQAAAPPPYQPPPPQAAPAYQA